MVDLCDREWRAGLLREDGSLNKSRYASPQWYGRCSWFLKLIEEGTADWPSFRYLLWFGPPT